MKEEPLFEKSIHHIPDVDNRLNLLLCSISFLVFGCVGDTPKLTHVPVSPSSPEDLQTRMNQLIAWHEKCKSPLLWDLERFKNIPPEVFETRILPRLIKIEQSRASFPIPEDLKKSLIQTIEKAYPQYTFDFNQASSARDFLKVVHNTAQDPHFSLHFEYENKSFETSPIQQDTPSEPSLRVRTTDYDYLYVPMNSFLEKGSARKVYEEILEEQKHKHQQIILDLRANNGGRESEHLQLLDFFLEEGMIRNCVKRGPIFASDDSGNKEEISSTHPVFILVDKYSASSTEMFAHFMRKSEKALIIGEKTVGKWAITTKTDLKTSFKLPLSPTVQRLCNMYPQVDHFIPQIKSLTVRWTCDRTVGKQEFEGLIPDIPAPLDNIQNTHDTLSALSKLNTSNTLDTWKKKGVLPPHIHFSREEKSALENCSQR